MDETTEILIDDQIFNLDDSNLYEIWKQGDNPIFLQGKKYITSLRFTTVREIYQLYVFNVETTLRLKFNIYYGT